MFFRAISTLALLAVSLASGSLWGQGFSGALVSQSTAMRYGLNRAWYTQIQLDRGNAHIDGITYHKGMLFVQTSQAMVHALNAETGRTIWAEQIGRMGHPGLAPAANDTYVAIVNGSTLYIINRKNGRVKWDRRMVGSPGAGPAITDTTVFVPMVSGLIEAYNLEDTKTTPWNYKSAGRAMVQPVVTPVSVSWTTDKGNFYLADAVKVAIRHRLHTHEPIESRPAYWTPYLYACSLDGYVYAVNENTGQMDWKFSSGEPVSQPPVAISGSVYICPDDGGMYRLDGKNGQELWFAGGLKQFIAASPTRIYATDRLQRLAILDAKTGGKLAVMPLQAIDMEMRNVNNDRIYLASRSGVIQCLHETELRTPVEYVPPPPAKDDKKSAKQKEKPKSALEEAAEGDAMDAPAKKDMADDPFK